jgi:Tfp pilus assembly protein FimT
VNTEAWGMMFVLGLLALLTVLIVAVVWQVFATQRAKVSADRNHEYRKLAERSSAAQQRTAEQQRKISEDLGELRNRVSAIEKLLQESG